MNLEDALIEVSKATDAQGKAIILYHGPITSQGLRDALFDFLEPVDRESMFICGFAPGSEEMAIKAEASFWENMAKLANATAAALREGR